ncbi:MAG: isoprenylcysteine carboxylmethyltransferase family protein [Anaerolineales bacterium]
MLILKQISAILLLPFTATVIIPILILQLAGDVRIGGGLAFPGWLICAAAGILLIAGGLFFLAGTIRLFAVRGRGTLAPWHPPQTMVVEGPYRFARNPMITGVLSILLGEAVLWASLPLSGWFVFFAVLNAVYIPLFEEPVLERRFGGSYTRYKQNVPRWIPRFRPWDGK